MARGAYAAIVTETVDGILGSWRSIPVDLSDEEWELIADLVPSFSGEGQIGRPVRWSKRQIVDAINNTKLPAIFGLTEQVEAGGLMSYSASTFDNFRRSAMYVDKILRGAKPGELPIEQPTKFDLVVNLKTAKAIGITVPTSLLVRADKVIQ